MIDPKACIFNCVTHGTFEPLLQATCPACSAAMSAALAAMDCEMRDGVWCKPCEECKGAGCTAGYKHVCGGDDERCHRACPDVEQLPCEPCNCTGWLPITPAAREGVGK